MKIKTILLLLIVPLFIYADTWYPSGATLTPASTGFGAIKLTGTATSTAVNGFNITNGCFAINGSCISGGGGGGTVTSVATTYPVTGGTITNTGTIAIAFGTTTSNTWAGTQTFTNSPVFSTIGAGIVNSTISGTIYNIATSTPSVTAPITYSGTLGNLIGGASGSFGCTNASAGVTGCLTGTNWSTFNGKESVLTFGLPMLRTANNIAWVGLATTSQPSSSNLLVSNGGAGVYGVATSTLSASAPITGSFTQVGTGGSLGCTTASSGVGGCLSNTAFDTFNNKQTAISTSFPLQLSAGTLSWIGLATTSALTSGRVHYSTGVNTFADVATSSIADGTGITTTNGSSSFVLGSQPTINCNTGSATVFGCLTAANFNTFFNKIGTSSSATAGQVAYFTTTNGTPALLGSVATSSIASGVGITVTNGSTAYVLGAQPSIACNTASGSVFGCLASADWTTFNAKQSALTFTYPLVNTASTITTALTTTTSQTWAGTQTFTNAPILSSLTGVLLGNGASALTVGTTQTCTNQFFRILSGSFAVTCATVSLTADVTGTLPIANGGTATTTQVTNGVNYFDGTRITSGTVFNFISPALGLGTTTPNIGLGQFQISTTSGAGFKPQIILSDQGAPSGYRHIGLYSQGGLFAIATSTNTYATSTPPAFELNLNTGTTPAIIVGSSTPVAIIQGYAGVASTTSLLLEASSKGACITMKDTAGTGYTDIYTQGGVIFGKVSTTLTTCD